MATAVRLIRLPLPVRDMDVETALREIDEANAKHVGEEGYERLREEYERGLREVDGIAGGAAVEELCRHLAGHIRHHGDRPPVPVADLYAAAAVRAVGGEVPAESFLANA
ncbi:hypothetical protein GCM10027435_09450 [Haloparvum alkalitolerans]